MRLCKWLLLPTAIVMAVVARAGERPNIVYILCDDLGYGDVHALNPDRGMIATPHLDRLASEGMKFTDAHSPSAVCTPTRYGLLTGRYSWRTRLQRGVLNGESPPLVDQARLTVAEFLKMHGYSTACVGKWHLGLEYGQPQFAAPVVDGPLQHGFDQFFGVSASLDMPPFAWIDGSEFTQQLTTTKTFLRTGPAAPDFEAVDAMPTLTAKATEFIEQQTPGERPFFLYLPYTAPHTPIVPTDAWRGKSGLGDYGDFVLQVDAAIGQVLAAIDTAGFRENTLVVVTSDNGCSPAANVEQLESQGHYPSAHFRGYKADIWEGGHRVPMIVRWPVVVQPGTASNQLVDLVDLFATVADILQQPLPATAAVDSFSFLPLLEGQDQPTRTFAIHHSINGCFAIRQGNWKLEFCPGSGGWAAPRDEQARQQGLPEVQLYDLQSDPGETVNLQSQHADIVERLTQLLEQSIAQGRTTPGPAQENDVAVKFHANDLAAPTTSR